MKHRIAPNTGLGNNAKVLLSNTGKRDEKYFKAILDAYFLDKDGEAIGGVDYESTKNYMTVGIEPTYQGDPLKLICIHRNKEESYIATGQAFGYYGSGIRSKTKKYGDYKYKGKFVKFVDEWHKHLFGSK